MLENQAILLYLQSAKFAGDCLNGDPESSSGQVLGRLLGFLGSGRNPYHPLNPSKSSVRHAEQGTERTRVRRNEDDQ